MSRRQHVVRTDDKGGIGSPRSLGGCRILCSRNPCGQVNGQVQIATISVSSSTDYQKCFVSATIGTVDAWIPEPSTLLAPSPSSVEGEDGG